MTLWFLPEARQELFSAADYYEARVPGLGRRLRAEVVTICRQILRDPFLPRERRGGYRRVNGRVFPYYIAYFIRGESVIVAAVAHGHRKPEYWIGRLAR